MNKISFNGIEEKIGNTLNVVIDIGGRHIKYSNLKFIGMDAEHLIFQEEKGRSYILKNRIVNYN